MMWKVNFDSQMGILTMMETGWSTCTIIFYVYLWDDGAGIKVSHLRKIFKFICERVEPEVLDEINQYLFEKPGYTKAWSSFVKEASKHGAL